jgi:hypothetical protein
MTNVFLFFIFTFSISSSFALEVCERPANQPFSEIQNFSEESLAVTSKLTQKILGVTVTKFGANQGSGSVSVITNEKGAITAVQVKFNVDGKIETMVRTFDELSKGEKLEYVKGSSSKASLVVKKASGATIYPTTGGEFTFSILAEKPNKYIHYSLYLRKSGNSWIVKNAKGTTLSTVDLTPNAPWGDWNGTFSEAEFE